MFAKIASLIGLGLLAVGVALGAIHVLSPAPSVSDEKELTYATKICERGNAMFMIARGWEDYEAYKQAARDCQESREFYGSDQAFIERWING